MGLIITIFAILLYIISQIDDSIKTDRVAEILKEGAKDFGRLAYWDPKAKSYRMFSDGAKVKEFLYHDVDGVPYYIYVTHGTFTPSKIVGMRYSAYEKGIDEQVEPKQSDIDSWKRSGWI